MADIPSPLTWGTVTGNFGALNADSTDPGDVPDLDPVTGTVTLVPRIQLLKVYAATPLIAVAKTVTCTIQNGVLYGPDNNPGVQVVATDSPGIEPYPLQWEVRIAIEGAAVQPAPMVIDVPGGQTVNLVSIVPSNPSPPYVTVVSEQTKLDAVAASLSAQSAASSAVSAKDTAVASALSANSAATSAINAKTAAESARVGADGSASAALSSAQDALTQKNQAVTAKNEAVSARNAAQAAVTAAQGYATAASQSAQDAQDIVDSVNISIDTETAGHIADTSSATRKALDLVYARNVLSSARPPHKAGQSIFETDTQRSWISDGTDWWYQGGGLPIVGKLISTSTLLGWNATTGLVYDMSISAAAGDWNSDYFEFVDGANATTGDRIRIKKKGKYLISGLCTVDGNATAFRFSSILFYSTTSPFVSRSKVENGANVAAGWSKFPVMSQQVVLAAGSEIGLQVAIQNSSGTFNLLDREIVVQLVA